MSIDSCYEGVIAKLTAQGKIKEISNKLLSLNSNEERVLYTYEILDSLNSFPKFLEVKKNDKVAEYYRNLGNSYFKTSENYQALQYYNLSLLHSPTDSHNYALALSNRSAVLFSLRKYKECIDDIDIIFSLKYPENVKGKLEKRKSNCQEYVSSNRKKLNSTEHKQNKEIEKLLKFDGQPNKLYPCASSKLKVIYTEKMGRHVVANEDIKVGDILAVEKPYLILLLKDKLLFYCSYCLKTSLNLLPCEYCCFALYCSTECKRSSWKEYHHIECPLTASLIDLEFTKLEWTALRIVIKARSDFPNWELLLKAIETLESETNLEYRGHVKVNDEYVYDSQYYQSIHTLSSNIEKRSISDIFQKAVTAAVFLNFLKEKTDFMKHESEETYKKIYKFVAGTLLLHCMTVPTNAHTISCTRQNVEGNYVDDDSIGSAAYAFLSLLNHSCAPNVTRFSKLGLMTMMALRPIKKGMQLFDNYGSHHALQSRLERNMNLNFQYKFNCHCEACLDNWPEYFDLPNEVPRKLSQEKDLLLSPFKMEQLQKGDRATALKVYKPLCELAERLEPYSPCKDVAECQEAIKQCLAVFELLFPYINIVKWNAKPLQC